MKQTENNFNEFSLELVDSSIAVIIMYLDQLTALLKIEKKNTSEIENLANKFDETIDFDEELVQLSNKLLKMSPSIKNDILSCTSVNRFELLENLFGALEISENNANEELYFELENLANEESMTLQFENNALKFINKYLCVLKEKMNDPEYKKLFSDEMKKIINILIEEHDVFEIIEANEILRNLFSINNDLDSNQKVIEIFEVITKIDAISRWTDFFKDTKSSIEEE